jgi:hypothetical protein
LKIGEDEAISTSTDYNNNTKRLLHFVRNDIFVAVAPDLPLDHVLIKLTDHCRFGIIKFCDNIRADHIYNKADPRRKHRKIR